ncbi:MAG: serine hydrolase domain-containing protein [Cyclobacteriaceae bacterium]|nr:serine hydrolase domain-containing protein [Cyclobacteriaceae bacterium]
MSRKIFLIYFILMSYFSAQAQNALTIDSIARNLTHADMIRQLLVLEDAGELTDSIGGIVAADPAFNSVKHWENSLKSHGLAPLVFTMLNDKLIELVADENTNGLVNVKLLSAVAEPHLLYESGRYIGQKAGSWGLNGFVLDTELFPGDAWRNSEFSKGLEDSGMIPIGAIEFIPASDFDLERAGVSGKPIMIRINQREVQPFIDHWLTFLRKNPSADTILSALCREVLSVKSKYHSAHSRLHDNPIDPEFLSNEIARAAITLLANESKMIPVSHLDNRKIALVTVGSISNGVMAEFVARYTPADHFTINVNSSISDFSKLWSGLANYDLIIEAVYDDDLETTSSGSIRNFAMFQRWLNSSGRCITAWIGESEKLKMHESVLEAPCLLASWEKAYSGQLTPQAIFGGMGVEGVLPYSLSDSYLKGHGISQEGNDRLGYNLPESLNLDKRTLLQIDSLATYAISQHAIPGCQILVAKDDQVIYQKSFGFHTYDSLRLVKDTDLYDLASLTKVSAALPALMLLYDQGKFSLDATLSTYLPYFKNSNKADLTFRELLTHQAGLTPWIPFWQNEMKKNGKFRKRAISSRESKKYDYAIANGLYLKNNFQKHIYREIKSSPVGDKKYLYSDLSFYLYPEIVEKLSGQKYVDFLLDNFYKPLGVETITYNPLANYPIDRIVPTEYDSLFRKGQVHGNVHDEGAALMHGVSGHAGLFADANDLAKLWQMYCNYGEYGGRRFLSDAAMHEFTRCQFPENDNRRALGFDRPMPVPKRDGNTAFSVSQSSFGHTGFTGNFVWVDPEINLVYIFLSNRVYPTRNNTKLYDLNIRTNIQEVIYEAIRNGM